MSKFVEKIFDFVIKYPENVAKYLKTIWGFYIYYRNVLYRGSGYIVLYRPNFGEKNRAFVMSFRLIRHRRRRAAENGTVYKEYSTNIPIYSISYIPDT
jgi:hypothetical protein